MSFDEIINFTGALGEAEPLFVALAAVVLVSWIVLYLALRRMRRRIAELSARFVSIEAQLFELKLMLEKFEADLDSLYRHQGHKGK